MKMGFIRAAISKCRLLYWILILRNSVFVNCRMVYMEIKIQRVYLIAIWWLRLIGSPGLGSRRNFYATIPTYVRVQIVSPCIITKLKFTTTTRAPNCFMNRIRKRMKAKFLFSVMSRHTYPILASDKGEALRKPLCSITLNGRWASKLQSLRLANVTLTTQPWSRIRAATWLALPNYVTSARLCLLHQSDGIAHRHRRPKHQKRAVRLVYLYKLPLVSGRVSRD